MGRKDKGGNNYKVRCTGYAQDREKYFTIGKVYEVKNNTITSDTGYTYGDYGRNVIDWLKSWYKFEVVNDECIVIYRKGNEVIALNKTTGEKGVAKRSPDDEFDFMVGAKLAFDRLVGLGVKEVKRRAKVGEYIKIVATNNDRSNDYHNGDILKVVKTRGEWTYYKDECGKFAYPREYVVLENYCPTEEPLYNGKVVCIDNVGNKGKYTVGKVYTFKDGIMEDADDGITVPDDEHPVHNFEEWSRWTGSRFVELVE